MTQICRVCGCTNFSACAGGCWWVEDELCSACAIARSVRAAKVDAAIGDAQLVEARASVALDRNPDFGTHSLDDGCAGGHR